MSYNKFAVGPANSQYQLSISGFIGITTDLFGVYNINGMKFTTKDRDNDECGFNCAVDGRDGNAGGWWYKCCSYILPNHQYKHNKVTQFYDKLLPLSFIEMKIKSYKC